MTVTQVHDQRSPAGIDRDHAWMLWCDGVLVDFVERAADAAPETRLGAFIAEGPRAETSPMGWSS